MNVGESRKSEADDRGASPFDPATISCSNCAALLNIEHLDDDDRSLCPECGATMTLEGHHNPVQSSFNSSRVMVDILLASFISATLISSTLIVLDVLPSLVASLAQQSVVRLIAWGMGAIRRTLVVIALSPIPGMTMAFCLSPFLHREQLRWQSAFRSGFVFCGPVFALSASILGAIWYWNKLGAVPAFYLHGTIAIWLAVGYVVGTITGVRWAWQRWARKRWLGVGT